MPRFHPRRAVTVVSILGIFILLNLIAGQAAVDTEAYQALRKANPFSRQPSAHPPPLAANSTSGDSSWFNNWNWLNPFSSTITLDESTSVLPPLRPRTYIYSYYDNSLKRTEAQKKLDNELLLTWRRAWWAQGFHPVVLSREDAESNPLYVKLRVHKLREEMEVDAMRWLAWARMGSGVLCDYRVVPMSTPDNSLLRYLRRGSFPDLTKYPNVGDGNTIFSGPEQAISNSIKYVLDLDTLGSSYQVVQHLSEVLKDESANVLADYSEATIKERYEEVQKNPSLLPALINSHLHLNYHTTFADGIYIGKPAAKHTTVLSEKGVAIAKSLAKCPESPIPTSCPPTLLRCGSCDPARPLKVSLANDYVNGTSKFTIMTVPHPYTFLSLTLQKDVTVPVIRRSTQRDGWVIAATQSIFKRPVGGAPRVVKLKEAVASDWAASHSLWLTPEMPDQDDLEWHFGFTFQRDPKTEKNIPVQPASDSTPSTSENLNRDRQTMMRAIDMTRSKKKHIQSMIAASEAWNLADTEIWRFVKAFNARQQMERNLWQQKESKYAGGGSTEGAKKGWSKWLDS